MTDAAGQTARLPDVADLAAPFQLSRPTTRDYVTLLARVFLLEPLPPWQTNRLSRPVKTPKLRLSDTGLPCALLATDAATQSSEQPTWTLAFGRPAHLHMSLFRNLRIIRRLRTIRIGS